MLKWKEYALIESTNYTHLKDNHYHEVEKLKVFLTILLVNTMDMLDYQDKRCTGKDKKTAMIYSNDKENQVSRVQTIVIFG